MLASPFFFLCLLLFFFSSVVFFSHSYHGTLAQSTLAGAPLPLPKIARPARASAEARLACARVRRRSLLHFHRQLEVWPRASSKAA